MKVSTNNFTYILGMLKNKEFIFRRKIISVYSCQACRTVNSYCRKIINPLKTSKYFFFRTFDFNTNSYALLICSGVWSINLLRMNSRLGKIWLDSHKVSSHSWLLTKWIQMSSNEKINVISTSSVSLIGLTGSSGSSDSIEMIVSDEGTDVRDSYPDSSESSGMIGMLSSFSSSESSER